MKIGNRTPTNTKTEYVFIAGLPRTGTTLLRSLLNCSEDVGVSMGEAMLFPAPHFLGLLHRHNFHRRLAQIGDSSSNDDLKKIVNYFYDTPQNNFWKSIPENIGRQELFDKLKSADNKEKSLFEIAMKLGAQGKRLAGDKTPAHIYYVPTLLEWFPNSKVVHTLRDPRAVYISQKKKYETKRKSSVSWLGNVARRMGLIYEIYSSLDMISNWLRVTRLHYEYQQVYPNRYHLIRYEDLITNPEPHLHDLCDFLHISFTEEMLQQKVINSSFVSNKAQVKGFNTTAITRWRQTIHPIINKWFIFWCNKQLVQFGYQP